MRFRYFAIAFVALSALAPAQEQAKRTPDVPYVPTPDAVVQSMLKLANIQKSDLVYDLGCGDGRIVIAAAKLYGAHGVGVDINPQRIEEARANAKQAGVENLVQFVEADLFEVDIRKASVVTLYLLPTINLKLRPKLMRDLKPGTRVVSHAFDMDDWKPEKQDEVDGRHVYFWTIPEKTAQGKK
jgi:SAM-dependent methyltransferase